MFKLMHCVDSVNILAQVVRKDCSHIESYSFSIAIAHCAMCAGRLVQSAIAGLIPTIILQGNNRGCPGKITSNHQCCRLCPTSSKRAKEENCKDICILWLMGSRFAKQATLNFFEKFKTPVVMGNEPDKEILKMVARTTLRTKIEGLVLDHGSRHPDMKRRVDNCHILTYNASLE